jgi:hypothetical protein
MRGKLVLLIGFGIGYVLGARAGRERYEQIKRAATNFWNSPRVQHQVQNVEDFAREKAPDVVDFLSDNAKKAVQRKPAAGKTPAKKAASTRAGGAKK